MFISSDYVNFNQVLRFSCVSVIMGRYGRHSILCNSYTLLHVSGEVLCFHIGGLCVCLSGCLSEVRTYVCTNGQILIIIAELWVNVQKNAFWHLVPFLFGVS